MITLSNDCHFLQSINFIILLLISVLINKEDKIYYNLLKLKHVFRVFIGRDLFRLIQSLIHHYHIIKCSYNHICIYICTFISFNLCVLRKD